MIAAVIRTDERAVDVKRLAARLRERVESEPRITFHRGAHITSAARENGSIKISFTRTGACRAGSPGMLSTAYGTAGSLSTRTCSSWRPIAHCSVSSTGVSVLLKQPNGRCSRPPLWSGRLATSCSLMIGTSTSRVSGRSERPVSELAPPDWPRELDGDAAGRMIDETMLRSPGW